MASQGRRVSLPTSGEDGILARVSNAVSQSSIISQGKRIASDTAYVTKKLLRSTGKAAWIAGTTFVILVVPLIIEMDREQQFNEMELQQASLLGAPPAAQQKFLYLENPNLAKGGAAPLINADANANFSL
ncbi:Mitochondrial import receptor subunit Tom22 [Dillenia turbinata]|uniref:Mitochondrial import receptor subunit Tom22 n=1 Tax=Dillenia turbinata TaxID=194707 RepID=A0AAN8ZDH6_9MAGN